MTGQRYSTFRTRSVGNLLHIRLFLRLCSSCSPQLFVMWTVLLFAIFPLVVSEEKATSPRPPASDYLNGSLPMDHTEIPIRVAPPFKKEEEPDGKRRHDPWYLGLFRHMERYLVECRKKTGAFDKNRREYKRSLVRMRNCLTESFLTSLDSVLDKKEIRVNPFLTIIKEENIGDKMDPREEMLDGDLISAIFRRFSNFIDTHSFKISFYDPLEDMDKVEGRRRHRHYRKAFPMMVAGYMMMSAFLVPLGFQFMAMIGGKALLLAKMAFFMSIFSGYKRLAGDLDYHHHGGMGGHELFHQAGLFHHRSAEMPEPYASHPSTQFFSIRKG